MDFLDRKALLERLRELIAPTVEQLGFELWAVVLGTDMGRQVLRVHIEREGGVGIDDCGRVSRALSPVLDVEDPVPGAYVLEVSSPGLDRPLQTREHFERFVGQKVKLKLGPGPARRRYSGIFLGFAGSDLRVDVDGSEHLVPFDQVDKATLHSDLTSG